MNAPFERPFRSQDARARRRDAPPYRRKILFEALEPRMLLSADLASPAVADAFSGVLDQKEREQAALQSGWQAQATQSPALISFALDGAVSADLTDESWIVDVPAKAPDAIPPIQSQIVFLDGEGAPATNSAQAREIVFVDQGIEDYESLLGGAATGVDADTRVVILDASDDGVRQISEALRGERDLDAIHILSHGSAGGVDLGSARLDASTLESYADQLATWRAALGSDADILLYGCNVAAGEWGVAFVQELAALTGADIAASDDLTGAAALGGDWDLEVVIGDVSELNAVSSLDLGGYAHTLLGTIDLANDREGNAATFTIIDVGNGSVTLTVQGATVEALNGQHIGVTSVTGKQNMANVLEASSDAGLRYLIKKDGTVEVYDVNDLLVLTARNIENLEGGGGTDKFQLEKGAQLKGDLTGGGGRDTLEYQGELDQDNRVDLRAGAGSIVGGVAGRVESIEIVLGAQSKDVLIASDRGGDVFEGREGDDKLIGGANKDTLYGGDGADILAVGTGGDKLYGGRDNDTYRFGEVWDAPEVLEELVNGGRDELDFRSVAGSMTVTLESSAGEGIGIKNSDPAVPDLGGVKYIEILRADLNAGQSHRYVFSNGWAEGLNQGFVSILHSQREGVQGGTVELSFNGVDADLLFELGADGEVTVFDNSDAEAPAKRLYATHVTDLVVGKGSNTFVIKTANALSGVIKKNDGPQAGQRNVLDYSQYSGQPIVVDLLNGRATGIGGAGAADQQGQAQNEIQQILFTPGAGTPGGTFRLSFKGGATGDISLATDANGIDSEATRANIATALGNLGAEVTVRSLQIAKAWSVEFTSPGNLDLPEFGVVESAVTGGSLSVTTTRQGVAETGSYVPTIREVKAGSVGLTLIGADLLDKPVAGSSANDILVAESSPARSAELDGSAGRDQLMGGSAGDILRGGDGVDTLYGLGGGDTLDGGNERDFLFGGAGVDILKGGSGNDWLEGGVGSDSLDGGQGDDTYVFHPGFGQDVLADPAGTDTLDFSGLGGLMAFSVSGGGLTAGTGVFTRDADRTVDLLASLRPSSGSFAEAADTVTVAAFKQIENITLGTGDNSFYFDKVGHSVVIDARAASSLALDFQATVQALEFEFATDANTGVTTLTVKENSTIQKGLSFFHLKTLPVITVIGVDKNTTIWGGRNDNVFQLKGGASFEGTVRGGTGKKLTTIPLTDTVVIDPTGLFVGNALDYSGSNFLRPRIVNLSAIFGSTLQSATGFGTVIDVSDVRYGASIVNIVAGTNVSPSGLGSNTFSPGTMSLPLGPGVPTPGIHVFAGGTGADTYKFNNLWGFAAVIEPPDLVIDGTAAPEFFDTLDFSGAFGDFRIVIDNVTPGNLSLLAGLLPQNTDDDPDNDVTLEVGTNFITVVDRGGPLALLQDALGAIGVSQDFLDSYVPDGSSILYALDIENIVTSRFGNTEIVFKDGAVLKGTIDASTPGGTVDLDYSEYFPDDHAGPGVTVEAGAGGNAVVPGFSLGAFELPTFNFTWGSATGVSGHRLSGATDLLVQTLQVLGFDGAASDIADFLGDFAVSGIRNVTGTPYADTLIGNYKNNVLTGLGGADTIDGVGDSRVVIDPFNAGTGGVDTVSFASIDTPVAIDLDAGTGTIYAADGVTVVATLARLANLRNVVVGPGGGEFTGSSANNVFFLTDGFGDTVIHTGGGRDTIDVTGVTTPLTADVPAQGSLIVTTVDGANVGRTVTANGDVALEARASTVTYSRPSTPLTGNTVLALPEGVMPDGAPVPDLTLLTADELAPIVEEAARRWREAGVLPVSATDDELDSLASRIDIVDLPDGMLARENPLTGRIELDAAAAGFGWFVDPSPSTDTEFETTPDVAAAAHIDLLTVVMHEIGHVLALGHAGVAIGGNLMSSTLGPGERRRPPLVDEVTGLTPSDEAALALGLGAFGDWIQDLGPQLETLFSDTLSLPFVDLSFADLFGIDPGTGQAIADAVASRVRDAVQAVFDDATGPVDTDLLLAIPGLELVPSSNLKEYRATLDLWRFHDEVSPDFDSPVFAALGLSGSEGFSLDVDTSLDLDFVFGLDASNQFYVLDPGVTARLFLGHDADNDGVADPFDLGINLGIIGAEIQDGVLDLSAALRIGADARLTYADLIADTVPASSLRPSFDVDSYYLVDLPVAMTGLLSGLNGDGLRLRAESGEVPAYGGFADFFLGAGSFQGLELSAINLDDILSLRNVSLDDLLAGLQQLVDTLAAPDGPLYEEIPLIGVSVAGVLGDGVVSFAEGFGQALDTVRDKARNIGELEAQLNTELQDFFGLGDVDLISMSYADSAFDFDLDLETLIQRRYELSLGIEELNLQQWLGFDPSTF
ncbi:MAG: DUF4347 domain-containing protein, partial [Betaproteobacteria bacterium]|nr:DUF4347 domain-containing protein [Betaproteobacteria bacterium]